MFNPRFIRIIGLLAVLTATFAATAQSAPRSAPLNDDFATTTQLVAGASVKISDPSSATVEVGEINGCGGSPNHSVWFHFTPVSDGTLYLSTAGTQLNHPYQSTNDTILGVWTGASIATLVSVQCNDDFGNFQSELSFTFVAGTTYHIQLSTFSAGPFTPDSYFKLTSRIALMYLPIQNASFEALLSPTNWKLKNGTSDTIVCSDPTYPPAGGICTFKFTGGGGENSKLTQTVNIPAGYKLRKNGMIFFYGFFRGMDSATIENAKVTATLIYANGTPSSKSVSTLSGLAQSGSYAAFTQFAYLAHASLVKVKLAISYKSTSGTMLLDTIVLHYGAGAVVRAAGVLPAPAPARGN